MYKVLVVDDSKMVRKILKKSFLAIGIKEDDFFEAGDGNEAIEMMMLAEEISLIITDINMPGMNGADFVKMIRKNSDYASSKIVVLSSVANEENREKFGGFHIDSYLNKPFTQEAFENIIVPILFSCEVIQTLEKLFLDELQRIDTQNNRFIFSKEFTQKCKNECEGVEDTLVQLIESVLKKALRLSYKDKIFFDEDTLIVERFVDKVREEKKVIKKVKEEIERIEPEENFINHAIKYAYTTDIDFNLITNIEYEHSFKEVIQKVLLKELTERFFLEKSDAALYINYLFTKRYSDILFAIADSLLFAIGKNDKGAIKFLNFYSGGIKFTQGIKVKVPSLLDDKGERVLQDEIIKVSQKAYKISQDYEKKQNEIRTKYLEIENIDQELQSQEIEAKRKENLEKSKKSKKHHIALQQEKAKKIKAQNESMTEKIDYYKKAIATTLNNSCEILEGKIEDITTPLQEESSSYELYLSKLLGNYEMFLEAVIDEKSFLKKLFLSLDSSPEKVYIDFAHITHFKNFQPQKISALLYEILYGSFLEHIQEKHKDEEEINTIKENQSIKVTIEKFATSYQQQLQKSIAKKIANSFFLTLKSVKKVDIQKKNGLANTLEMAIMGIDENESIVKRQDKRVVNKLSTVWVKLQQANQKKKEHLTTIKSNSQRSEYQQEVSKDLYHYDRDLKRIFDVMVENISQRL